METDNRIMVILACLRGGIAGIYTQKKLDELDKELEIQDWEEFVKEIKTMFSNKIKAVDAEWRIESFKQGKKNTVDFMIEFEALAMKVDIDKLYAIFFTEGECTIRHYQDDTGIPTYCSTRDTQGVEGGNHLSWTWI